ncbi:MAG: calcium-binding protein, partial [Leptolyngbya sp. SIO3F4]|nr:calcium-binding protein [Leptolyngbya sp. SIO3F4]
MIQFNFSYDPGISIEQRIGFELAALIWGAYLTDDIAVNLHIVSTDTLEGNAIGGAIPLFHEQNYGVLTKYLEQDTTTSPDGSPSIDEQALDSLQEGNTIDVLLKGQIVDGNTNTLLTSSQAKALGMDEAITLDNGTVWNRNLVESNSLDGYIIINQSYDWNYDFLRENKSPKKTLDFLTLAMHEIGHQLGFVSGLDGLLNINQLYSGETQIDGITILDLFRQTVESKAIENPDGTVS